MAVILAAALWTCASNGVHQAEELATPFPGIVLAAEAGHGRCDDIGCPIEYRLRFTNPTGRDANVKICELADGSLRLPLNSIAGLDVEAHATQVGVGSYVLPIEKQGAAQLVGREVSCIGLDWQGHPPI
jgi:hypothetical protein